VFSSPLAEGDREAVEGAVTAAMFHVKHRAPPLTADNNGAHIVAPVSQPRAAAHFDPIHDVKDPPLREGRARQHHQI
jgi:hypothetical protein